MYSSSEGPLKALWLYSVQNTGLVSGGCSDLSGHPDEDTAGHGPVALVGLQVGGEGGGRVEEDGHDQDQGAAEGVHLTGGSSLYSHGL